MLPAICTVVVCRADLPLGLSAAAVLLLLSQGKLETEDLLRRSGVNFTSIRPVYIYGPLNYNPVEEYFFHRLKAGRPIVVPGSGVQVSCLPPVVGYKRLPGAAHQHCCQSAANPALHSHSRHQG
jgi:hypothetical protein